MGVFIIFFVGETLYLIYWCAEAKRQNVIINIKIMVLCVFLGGEKWVSEKGKIIIEIRWIFKIVIKGGNIIPVKIKFQNTILKLFFLHRKNRVWFWTTTKTGKDFELFFFRFFWFSNHFKVFIEEKIYFLFIDR